MPHRKTVWAGCALALAATLPWGGAALAGLGSEQMGHVEMGRELAQAHCSGCHAVEAEDSSPLPEAPAFRDLHHRYPVAHLAESLAEGIAVGHPAMPEFVLEPGEVEAFIRYLESLEE